MFGRRVYSLVLLCLLGFAAPASSQVPAVPPEQQVQPPLKEKTEASPLAAAAAVDPKSYRIGAEDILKVDIWREPELSGLKTVRPDGKINLQLVGEIDAMNLTPNELEANITKAYEKVLKNPIVTLQVQRVESKKYYMSGEIFRPGAYSLVSPTTILQALTMSGGVREFGNSKKIIIMRGTERIKFNLNEVIKGKKLEQNVMLQPDDHIIVP